MAPIARSARWVTALLAGLVVFDCVIAVWASVFPQLWFDAFHGVRYVDPEALLRRTAAQWAGFALIQLVALIRWRREPWWLVAVAGVRLCDVFTDLVYVIFAQDLTWFARLTLPAMGPINALLAWLLIRAWKAGRS
jgi:hypothetical protein